MWRYYNKEKYKQSLISSILAFIGLITLIIIILKAVSAFK